MAETNLIQYQASRLVYFGFENCYFLFGSYFGSNADTFLYFTYFGAKIVTTFFSLLSYIFILNLK